jgi:hypothetical protein
MASPDYARRDQAGLANQIQISRQITETEPRDAALLLSEQLTRPTQFEVSLSQAKPISGVFQNAQPLLRDFRRFLTYQNAVRIVRSSTNPAPQLMKLSQTELLGIFDEHDGCIRHVDSDFDHGSRHQDLQLSGPERGNDFFPVPRAEPAMHHSDTKLA